MFHFTSLVPAKGLVSVSYQGNIGPLEGVYDTFIEQSLVVIPLLLLSAYAKRHPPLPFRDLHDRTVLACLR